MFVSAKTSAGLRRDKRPAPAGETALLNLLRTHEFLQRRQTEFFKGFQLTPTQYNVLRILRNAGADGATCFQAAERMIAADPDITRLMDRLEARNLIVRERRLPDRRVVVSRITEEGLDLLKTIEKPLRGFLGRTLGRLGSGRLAQLSEILESIRRS